MMLRWPALLLTTLLLAACAHQPCGGDRPFKFDADTFSYANELVWEYGYNPSGKWKSHRRNQKPDYTHHCFVVARCARQFFQHARFDPARPRESALRYRTLVKETLSRNPRHTSPEPLKVVIPGFANLREFSQDHESVLKERCGGAWQSYLQRGHWRMMAPFTRGNQERMAAQLQLAISNHCPPVVHLIRFPKLSINHAVVLFAVEDTPSEIVFSAYDPNNPKEPAGLRFDRSSRTFRFPQTDYFIGGRVDVYQVYHSYLY